MASDNEKAVLLRRADPDDAALLSEIEARLFEQTFGAANTPEDMRQYLADSFTVAKQRAEIEDTKRVVLLAEVDGKTVGYATVLRGSTTDSVDATRAAEVERIYVDRSLHGMRVGDQLMDACVEQARSWSCDVLWLAVWERNPRAIAFYERRGFRRRGTKTFELGSDVQHDYVMALRLA